MSMGEETETPNEPQWVGFMTSKRIERLRAQSYILVSKSCYQMYKTLLKSQGRGHQIMSFKKWQKLRIKNLNSDFLINAMAKEVKE